MGSRVRRRIGQGELHCPSQCHEIVYGNGPSRSLERFSSVLKKGARGSSETLIHIMY